MRKKRLVILGFILILTIACSFGYDGINFGSDPDIERIEDQTATAQAAQSEEPMTAGDDQESTPPPLSPQQSSSSETFSGVVSDGNTEYSVSATNSGCTCSVDGNFNVKMEIKGDTLEYTPGGSETQLYNKIGNNTYKRTYMGYYILSSGSGAQTTQTIVDEERHDILILNDDGYVMEHYQGEESSACCFHSFTRIP